VPDSWGGETDAASAGLPGGNGSGSASTGVIVGSVVGVLLVLVASIVGIWYYRRGRFSEPHMVTSKSTTDLHLEADGGTMREDDDGTNNNNSNPHPMARTSTYESEKDGCSIEASVQVC